MSLNRTDLQCIADLVVSGIVRMDHTDNCPSRRELQAAFIQMAKEATMLGRAAGMPLSQKMEHGSQEDILSEETAHLAEHAKEQYRRADYFVQKAKDVMNPVTKAYHHSMLCITGELTDADDISEALLLYPRLPERTRDAFPQPTPPAVEAA